MDTKEHTSRRAPWLLRIARARPQLVISGAVGIGVTVALPALTDWRLATCVLGGWDIATAMHLGLVFHMMARADVTAFASARRSRTKGRSRSWC